MKVLGVAGSPRKNSNSTFLVKEALRAAEEEGAETELILLKDKNIQHCDGCWSCRKTGKCHINDDMQEIYEKLKAADGIIVGSPTYVGNVTSICQAFLERCTCFIKMKSEGGRLLHSEKKSALGGKAGGAIVTGRRRGVQGALDVLNFYLMVHGMVITHAGVAGFCQSLEPGAIKDEDKDAVAMSAELGKVVVDNIKKYAREKVLV